MDGIIISMDNVTMKQLGQLEQVVGRYLHLDSAGEYQGMPGHYMKRARPINYLAIWVLGGRGFARTEGQHCKVQAGDLLTFRRQVPQEYGADPQRPWHIVWLHYSGQLGPLVTAAIREHGGPCVRLGLDDRLVEQWRELVVAQGSGGPAMRLGVNMSLQALVGRIIGLLAQRGRADGKGLAFDLHKVHLHIHNHLDEPITLGDLARLVNLSPTHFARVFRQHHGVAPIDYVIQKRMLLAASLLTDTSMPLKQVCVRVGYNDPFYFSRLFKKVTGLNPSAYRRRHAVGNELRDHGP
jgi:AraC family transcriptional regulator of arabinose operon